MACQEGPAAVRWGSWGLAGCCGAGTSSDMRCRLQLEELEEQCSEINREREKNSQLRSRIEALETELRDKETVSSTAPSLGSGLP